MRLVPDTCQPSAIRREASALCREAVTETEEVGRHDRNRLSRYKTQKDLGTEVALDKTWMLGRAAALAFIFLQPSAATDGLGAKHGRGCRLRCEAGCGLCRLYGPGGKRAGCWLGASQCLAQRRRRQRGRALRGGLADRPRSPRRSGKASGRSRRPSAQGP